jgi:hypothetical protein
MKFRELNDVFRRLGHVDPPISRLLRIQTCAIDGIGACGVAKFEMSTRSHCPTG